MKQYAAAIVAIKDKLNGTSDIFVHHYVVQAANDYEAIGRAYLKAVELYPFRDQWTRHHINVLQITG